MSAESSLSPVLPGIAVRVEVGWSLSDLHLLRLGVAGGLGSFVASASFTWVKLASLPVLLSASALVLACVAHTCTHQLLGVSQCLPTAWHAVCMVQVEVSAPVLGPAAKSVL